MSILKTDIPKGAFFMSKKSFNKMFLSTGIGTGFGMLFFSVLVFIMASILAIGNIPAAIISPITVIFLAIGSFSGGFISAKIYGEKGILCGTISGIIFFIFILIFGALFEKSGFGTQAITKAVMVIVASALGGITGVNYIKRK